MVFKGNCQLSVNGSQCSFSQCSVFLSQRHCINLVGSMSFNLLMLPAVNSLQLLSIQVVTACKVHSILWLLGASSALCLQVYWYVSVVVQRQNSVNTKGKYSALQIVLFFITAESCFFFLPVVIALNMSMNTSLQMYADAGFIQKVSFLHFVHNGSMLILTASTCLAAVSNDEGHPMVTWLHLNTY